ncbi:hypothetical protein KGF54_002912 [Candida jiufengensis]|uniref:uncharacterized protein n=1 Tax=Candida jiufengensis TaxID=497108 RepID=UPI002224FDBB|nr:uncharacterized protein KGF54_002912 [Candida jiufengensis]KAI5953540.1 hypothetical protein KGF54_002912 [Candida jiufengensis]
MKQPKIRMKILIFQTSWFLHPNQEFISLRQLINKGYDKSRQRFNLIETQRIRSIDSLIHDLGITKDQQFYLYLLIDEEINVKRHFENEVIESCYQCDIPEREIKFDKQIDIQIVSNDFELNHDKINQCIATLAFKSLNSPNEFELTLYTSFMKSIGYKFLNYVLDNRMFSSTMIQNLTELVIVAECVKEYGLDEYYQKFCNFEMVEDDLLITVDNEKNLDDNVWWKASRDFHLSLLNKKIQLKETIDPI